MHQPDTINPMKKRKAPESTTGGDANMDQANTIEPMKKRKAPESTTGGEARKSDECIRKEISAHDRQIQLPDPNEKVSPDEFLLQLLKALHGVSLEVKPALSLDSFFADVTEEQMVAYNIEVIGAARTNNLEELKKLHGAGQAMNCSNRFGESLLNLACRRGFESIVEFLLEQPETDLRICDDGGRTPLHDACWHPSPQLKICKWIIEREPSLFLISDKRGFTAFQYARSQHWDIWRKFLFENRDSLQALTSPELLERLAKD
jgi:hypothetical protein